MMPDKVQCFMILPIFGELREREKVDRYEFWNDHIVTGWLRPGTEEKHEWPSQFGPGAMWFAWDTVKGYQWDNETEPHLHVILPNGHGWDIDSRCSNCALPNDKLHRCWVRAGSPHMITVGKAGGATCAAGAGSIFSCQGSPQQWHGFLTNGILSANR